MNYAEVKCCIEFLFQLDKHVEFLFQLDKQSKEEKYWKIEEYL